MLKQPLEGKRVGVFITGGIASYKAAELVRQLIKKGCLVKVAMTKAATEFITPLTLQTLSKNKVLVDVFNEEDPKVVQHIAFADWCELAIVAPATANTIAKIANGIADEIVSTCLLAVTAPKIVVPSMNVNMYENPATQKNLRALEEMGIHILEPDTGFLAEGYQGKGRMPEPSKIVQFAESVIAKNTYKQVLKGKKVIVTGGGTVERIDPVRYISNDSSGKMGFSLAETAAWLGAEVEFVTTKTDFSFPKDMLVTPVKSAKEMKEAVEKDFNASDYVVMAAAVSDYRVKSESGQKIKKEDSKENELILELTENPDILATLGENKTHQVLVGFAAESNNVLEYARAKLTKKKADWIIANDISKENVGFNYDTNQVTVIGKDTEEELPNMSKRLTALNIWRIITEEK